MPQPVTPIDSDVRRVALRDAIPSPGSTKRNTMTLASAAVVICLVAIGARWMVFGDPLVHADEELYLLVGNRMLHGAILYIDLWDRKPVGLFLLFAGARLLGGDGVLQYQILALIFVCATALILFIMGRRIAGPGGGLLAALLYVFYLDLAGGEAGQAPVWYNLPVAGAIAIIFFARTSEKTRSGDFRLPGIAAMLLFGIALQIKYNAMFEGVFGGVTLLVVAHRRGRPLLTLATDGAIWIGCALLPTLIIAGTYAKMGYFHEWFFANFFSITQRGSELPQTIRWRIIELATILIPLVATIPLRRWSGATPRSLEACDDLRFIDAWAACSLLAVVLFGTWFNHYALPTFVPLAVAAAPLATRRYGRVYTCLLLVGSAAWGQHILHRHEATRGDRLLLAAVTAAIGSPRDCLFVYDGLVAAYDSTQSCLPTPHIFPTHFAGLIETGATGINQEKLIRTIMAREPERVTSMEPAYTGENLAVRGVFYRALQRRYVEIARLPRGDRTLVVYGLIGTTSPKRPES